MGKVYNNYPAQLAPLSSEKTQLQVRRNEVQTLQTLAHHWEVCKSRKSLTAMLVRMVLQPAAEKNVCCDCLARLAAVGSLRMGPSEHAANLSKFDSLSMSSLHVVEKVIHTAVRPASEPCDEERHLLYQADAVDAVGEAGCSNLASSDHAANSANSDVSMHRGLHELQDNARAIAHTHQ